MTKYVKIISLAGIIATCNAFATVKNPMTSCPTGYTEIWLYDVNIASSCISSSSYILKMPADAKACDTIDTGHPYEACYVYAPADFNFYDNTGTWQFTSDCLLSNPF